MSDPATPRSELRPTVIALIDSGTSPYYEIFTVADEARYTSAIPIPTRRVSFSLPGDETDPVERDAELWAALEPKVLYQFAGTRLFAIGFDDSELREHQIRDANVHGAATSYLAARDAPDALILVVQANIARCFEPSCSFSPTIADAMEWVSAQDWIDVVSVSLGALGNVPDDPAIHREMQRYMAASKTAAAKGIVIVNGAGNDPTPSLGDYFNGPPWIIGVGGLESEARGEQAVASKAVDVVANYTEWAPSSGRGELEWRRGTSFSTPVVAATLARAIGIVHFSDAIRDVTPAQLRQALNASAIQFQATDWDPTPVGREPFPLDVIESASLPILIQPQMGWGYVNSSLAPEIARRVLENDLSIPPGKEQAAIFQAEWQRAREEYWSRYA